MIIFVQSYESTTLAIEKLLCCCADEGESNQRTSDIHHNLYKHENDRVKVEKKNTQLNTPSTQIALARPAI